MPSKNLLPVVLQHCYKQRGEIMDEQQRSSRRILIDAQQKQVARIQDVIILHVVHPSCYMLHFLNIAPVSLLLYSDEI